MRVRGPECASRQNPIPTRRPIFFIAAQVVDASGKNALAYDECTSGPIIYGYVGNNPVNRVDPSGLSAANAAMLIGGLVGRAGAIGGGFAAGAQLAVDGIMSFTPTGLSPLFVPWL